MTQKEKAKAYDEALERAKKCLDENRDTCFVRPDVIFPELADKDERIRKTLIEYFNTCFGDYYGELKKSDILAWLEKQGEKKPTLPKWKYKKDNTPILRDSIILNKYGRVAKLSSGAIVSDVWVLDYNELAKLPKEELEVEQKQNWDEEDKKMFDYALDMIEWYSGKNEERVRLVSDWLKSLRQRIEG